MRALEDVTGSAVPPAQHLRNPLAAIDNDAIGNEAYVKLSNRCTVDPVVPKVRPFDCRVRPSLLRAGVDRNAQEHERL